jgi:hypothetical protein
LEALDFLSGEGEGWSRVSFDCSDEQDGMQLKVGDMEDLMLDVNSNNYSKLHEEACSQGKDTYIDPKSGYI